ncbi:hypothetical protein AB0L06_00795 [Spirillospora sp. NPDC052269]
MTNRYDGTSGNVFQIGVMNGDIGMRSGPGKAVPGRPLTELADLENALRLEVHHAIEAKSESGGLPVLPPYVPREHDKRLLTEVTAASEGASRIAILVGESSTGKTRSCWEALNVLRERPEPWRLWHPIDPSRPEALLDGLEQVVPHTVIWLNEAQHYLSDPAHGERVAAGLRSLLADPDRAPLLVLGTLWPNEWAALMTRPASGKDLHDQARHLLEGNGFPVPPAFTGDEMDGLERLLLNRYDPRLEAASTDAEEGRVSQYLAGVPVLLERYEHAAPPTRAVIHAAMDALRLGAGPHLPLAFLAEAAPGYLSDAEWELAPDDWLEQTLAYVGEPCHGIPGILTRVKTRPARGRSADEPLTYKLADYLRQAGEKRRALDVPPPSFWDACRHLPAEQRAPLSDEACLRGLMRHGVQLFKDAVLTGEPIGTFAFLKALDVRVSEEGARQLATELPLGDPFAVLWALTFLPLNEGKWQNPPVPAPSTLFLEREPARHLDLANPGALEVLVRMLYELADDAHLGVLLSRHLQDMAVEDVDPYEITMLVAALRRVGAREQADVLLQRILDKISFVDVPASMIVDTLVEAKLLTSEDELAALLRRAIGETVTGLWDATRLIQSLEGRFDELVPEVIRFLDDRDWFPDSSLSDIAGLLETQYIGSTSEGLEHVHRLLLRAGIADIPLVIGDDIADVLKALVRLGKADEAATLLRRDPARNVVLESSVENLLLALVDLRSHAELGHLVEQQLEALLGRDIVRHAPTLTGPLLEVLHKLGATRHVEAFLARFDAEGLVHDPDGILKALRVIGEEDRAAKAVEKLPALGLFPEYLEETGQEHRYRHGREPDGRPAEPWTWDDLD